MVGDGSRIQSSPHPQGLPPCVPSRGTVRGWRGWQGPLFIQPHYLPQALRQAAEVHRSIAGLGPRANIPRSSGKGGVPLEALVPAGASWATRGRRLGAELPPLAGSRHVAAAPLGTAGKVQREPGSLGKARKCYATSPTLVQPQTMEARFHSHFPLLGAAAGTPHPSDPGASPSRMAARCLHPTPGSQALQAPSPHFPLSRPLPTRLRRSFPNPGPGKEEGGGGGKGSQPRAWVEGGGVGGSAIWSGGAGGREGGQVGGRGKVDSCCGGEPAGRGAGSARRWEKGRKEGARSGLGRAGPGSTPCRGRRAGAGARERLSLSRAARARRPVPAAGPARGPPPRPPAAAAPGSCVSPPPGS